MRSLAKHPQKGFSYIEVLVAIALIAITLIPAMDALHTGVKGSQIHADETANIFWLGAKVAELKALSYKTLESEAAAAGDANTVVDNLSDAVGSDKRRLVYLALYDGDNADADDDPFTGVDEGLLWIRVEIDGQRHSLETLVRQ